MKFHGGKTNNSGILWEKLRWKFQKVREILFGATVTNYIRPSKIDGAFNPSPSI